MPQISTSGVWFDTQANKVVESPPEEGIQLVAPGGELTKTVQDDIDRYRGNAAAEPVVDLEPHEGEIEHGEVETAGETTRRKKS